MMQMTTWATDSAASTEMGGIRFRTCRKLTDDASGAVAYLEVYELAGRYYWSANIFVPYQPQLSVLAFGMYAAVPGALAVAKMRASRLALRALRKSKKPRPFVTHR